MLLEVMVLVLSVVTLFLGAELTLGAGEKLGRLFAIPPFMIGLLIIGFGTSLPEFFVSHLSAANGRGQMALGNLVGSNISNILLVLGLSLVVRKISMASQETLLQMILHLLLSLILGVILLFDRLHWLSCLVLMAFFAGYLSYLYLDMKRSQQNIGCDLQPDQEPTALGGRCYHQVKLFAQLLLGFVLLYGGGEFLIESGSALCQLLGLSEYVISVMFIALGTSLPELATALLAVWRGKNMELITGNVIGSNIFNISFVMASLIFYRIDLSRGFWVETSVLVISAAVLLIFSAKKWTPGRALGLLLVGAYGYMTYYWLQQG